MKKILFRIWDEELDRYIYPSECATLCSDGLTIKDTQKIEMYTGYQDSQECQIYEGDVVYNGDRQIVVTETTGRRGLAYMSHKSLVVGNVNHEKL